MTRTLEDEDEPSGANASLSGAAIISAVKNAGVEFVLSVPDLHTSKGILWPVVDDRDLRLIRVCKEDECFGIAAGLSYADKRALILIQFSGMLYAMNAIRAISCEHNIPTVMMVGLLSKEIGVPPTQSKRFGIRVCEPILDVLGIEQHYIDTDEDVDKIGPAIEKAYKTSRPVALLIGRRPV